MRVIHSIVVNVEDNTYKIDIPLDIHQGDRNTHVLFFQLRNNCDKYIQLNKEYQYQLDFCRDNITISSTDLEIVNDYRGQLSYVVGEEVVKNFGRFTSYLIIKDSLGNEIFTFSFPLVISKTHNFNPTSSEVVMTKEFYDSLVGHLDNEEIHLQEINRDFLDTFSDKIDEFNKLLSQEIDSSLSTESTNPVQNKVITEEINNIREELGNKDTEIYWNDTLIQTVEGQ